MRTVLQHQRIQHLQFLLRKAKRDLRSQPGRFNEEEVSWAQNCLCRAEEEAEDSFSYLKEQGYDVRMTKKFGLRVRDPDLGPETSQ